MATYLNNLIHTIGGAHLNVLFLLGLALFGGTIGGRLFQKLRIPQVVGYIVIGVLLGEAGLTIVDSETSLNLQPFNYFALGLIGFTVGGELRKDIFAKYGKQFMTILLCEGVAPFILVTILIGVVGSHFLESHIAWALGLLFGAIASATDPASTIHVFREYKSRGPLTTTATGIVALDDGLALTLFSIASSVAGVLLGTMRENFFNVILHPVLELGESIAVGVTLGFVLVVLVRRYSEKERLLAFTLGTILLATGLSIVFDLELLMVAMTTSIVLVNFTGRKSEEVLQLLGGFTPPIFVLFFVLIGARLNVGHLTIATVAIIISYLFGVIGGKIIGSRFGATISRAPKTVQRYLSFALFSQAGVAIGLSILAAQYLPREIGSFLLVVITATTFILQLIGPFSTKVAIGKAGEIGLAIDEEGLMRYARVEDAMDKNPPLIYKSMHLSAILQIFSDSNNLYYPVVDKEKKLLGIITVDTLKRMINETGLDDLLLAVDVMEPCGHVVQPSKAIFDVKKLLESQGLEYVPVVSTEHAVVGFIERRNLEKYLSTQIMELQRKVRTLEESR